MTGNKTFEVRKNDRGFQPGDIVKLAEWDPNKRVHNTENEFGDYTGRFQSFVIGYVFPLYSEKRVVFSLVHKLGDEDARARS